MTGRLKPGSNTIALSQGNGDGPGGGGRIAVAVGFTNDVYKARFLAGDPTLNLRSAANMFPGSVSVSVGINGPDYSAPNAWRAPVAGTLLFVQPPPAGTIFTIR